MIALAGSQTRIYCLGGSNADRYTTNAFLCGEWENGDFVRSMLSLQPANNIIGVDMH